MAPGFLIGCHRRREFLLLNLVAAEGRDRKNKLQFCRMPRCGSRFRVGVSTCAFRAASHPESQSLMFSNLEDCATSTNAGCMICRIISPEIHDYGSVFRSSELSAALDRIVDPFRTLHIRHATRRSTGRKSSPYCCIAIIFGTSCAFTYFVGREDRPHKGRGHSVLPIRSK
jgi:hypothetical protein